MESERDREEREFLQALIRIQREFLEGIRSRPRDMGGLIDSPVPPTHKYGVLHQLVKLNGYAALQEVHYSRQDREEGDRMGQKGFEVLSRVLQHVSDFPALAQHLDALAWNELRTLFDEGRFTEVLSAHQRIMKAYGESIRGVDTFHAHAFRAHTALAEGQALEALGRRPEARVAIDRAVESFARALPLLEELIPGRRSFFIGDAGRAHMVRAQILARTGAVDLAKEERDQSLTLFERALALNPLYGRSINNWRRELLTLDVGKEYKGGMAPLSGAVFRFRDSYGPFPYRSETVVYKTEDGASIEATLLTPDGSAPPKPGLVFVPMWARDRSTWWGFPEFLASHGYPSISVDLRGQGRSRFPGEKDLRVTLNDDETMKRRYVEFVRDVVPAIRLLSEAPSVQGRPLVVVGASLGCPVGVLAADKEKDKVGALVMLSPALDYFGVNCETALKKMSKTPLLVMGEKTDKSFGSAHEFFNVADGFKTWVQTDGVGHGTDVFYRDAGMPTVLLSWLEELERTQKFLPGFKRR